MTMLTIIPKPLPLQPEELDVLTPEDRKTMLEWMESDYYLSRKVHGLSDRWSSQYGPFWVPIIECLNDVVTREVWVYAPAQSGKSTIMTGWLGYTVDCDPVPMGLVMPREDDAIERVETSIQPMFEENQRLLRHAGGNINNINIGKLTMFDNMAFYLMFATSAPAMAGKAICRIGLDEVGKYRMKVGKEADAVSLARDRLETFKGRSKLFGITTPVLKDDLADREWKKGDCCEWWVPCQYCHKWHRPVFTNVKIERDEEGKFFEPEVYKKGGHAFYICPHCKAKWSEMDRWMAVCDGKYVPKGCKINSIGHLIGKIEQMTHRSFRITAIILHPAIQTIDYLVSKWVEADRARKAKDLGPLQGFINSRLAQVWQERLKEPEQAKLYPHIGSYERSIVPAGVQLLTAAVDVQLDHVWITIVGWGYQFEGWLIFAGRLETGNTERIENFDIVRKYLNVTWHISDNSELQMQLTLASIDSRYRTNEVYDICRQWSELPVVPLMGMSEDRIRGRLYRVVKLADGLIRYDINVDRFKDSVYRQLFVADLPGPGYIHLYKDIPDEYLKHFVSEHQINIQQGKREYQHWDLVDEHMPNHLWDCLVYCRFLAEISGVPSLPDPKEIVKKKRPKKLVTPYSNFLDDIPEL